MKKKMGLLLFTLLCFFMVNTSDVKAYYNGSGGTSAPAGGGTCVGLAWPCTWWNREFTAVQISLVYYDGNSWGQIGHSYYIINSEYYGYADKLRGDVGGAQYVEVNDSISTCGAGRGPYDGCEYGYEWLKRRYDAEGGGPNVANNDIALLQKMGVNPASLNRPHSGKIDYNSKGYRFVVEPILNWILPGQSVEKFMTVKEVFSQHGGTSNDFQHPTQSWLLHTLKDDIGIRAYGEPSGDIGLIGNSRSGYGYNIINPKSDIFQACYKISGAGTPAVCKNTNTSNFGSYQETYTKVDCNSATQEEKDTTENGRLVKTLNGSCKIYCKESVITEFPGNVLPASAKGSYFVWPSLGNGINDKHQLNIKGTRTCKAVGSGCSGNVNASDLYAGFQSSMRVSYNDPKYGREFELTQQKDNNNHVTESITCDGCAGIRDNKTITVNITRKYIIPDKIYRFIDNKTKESVDATKGVTNSPNYTDVGQGNLPISNKADIKKTYNLQIKDIKLGVNNIFGAIANKNTYTCNYKVKETSEGCKCPPGTKNSGIDLYPYTASEKLTCIEAQAKYCNGSVPQPPDIPKYCLDNNKVQIESCVNNSGKGYEYCYNKYCGTNGPYNCPGDNPGEDPMDVTGCVETALKQNPGASISTVLKYCQDTVCPGGTPKPRYIYRTINLENPFPSKNLDRGVAGFNLSVNSGRYPGPNWNSRELVTSKILNNRNVSANKVYNKEPIYVITLDPSRLRAVKGYNRAQNKGYADFTLNCYGKDATGNMDGSKCMSSFLRTNSILTGGTCNGGSSASFDSCLNG
ncbi:MAG: hypothetical protein PHN72_00440 [Bacilli bacterium]|nr:hypothetical protein [Bacilli bacterium]